MTSAQLKNFESVKPAQIEWREGEPFSTEFQDIYFSIHGGVEESQHVFIDGNNLPGDWHNSSTQSRFSILELGFGSGLNFLNTVHNWILAKSAHSKTNLSSTVLEHSQATHLDYVAIEKRPFNLVDLEKAFACWPQFQGISKPLHLQYPPTTYGRHQISFPEFNVTLTLLFMPVEMALSNLVEESRFQENKFEFDHCFLDGFAPGKNMEMWSEENARNISRLSKIGTRIASYSVAKGVRTPLENAGFELAKRKGFAKKREMLTGVLKFKSDKLDSTNINIKFESPWFNIGTTLELHQKQDHNNIKGNKIAVVGAGIAGCMTAFSLAKKGFACDIYDSCDSVGQGASGAAAGIFHPQVTTDMNIGSQFNLTCYHRLITFIDSLSEGEKADIEYRQGVIRYLNEPGKAKQILELSARYGFPSWIESANIIDANSPLFFPHAGGLNIANLCRLLVNKIDVLQQYSPHKTKVWLNSEVQLMDLKDSEWQLHINNAQKNYSNVIYCGGARSPLLSALGIKDTHWTRGQSCFFRSPELSKTISNIVSEQIYLVPHSDHYFHLGSTFEDFEDATLNSGSQVDMLKKLVNFLKNHNMSIPKSLTIDTLPIKGTVGYRLHSSDRLPLVGALFDQEKLKEDFIGIGQKQVSRSSVSHYARQGLWINSGFGSHGLLYSLTASEHLCSQLSNSISPINFELSKAINPARFYIKSLKNKSYP